MIPATRPRTSIDTAPYWEGCKAGKLLYQRCLSCDEVVFHARALCPYCLEDALEWRPSAGRGSVYAFSLQHVHIYPDRPAGVRVLGIAELDEGFHMFSEFLTRAPEAVRIGTRLEVTFERIDDDLHLPKFRITDR